MGRLVFNKDAKELCLDSCALAASALFHNALINIDAKYNVLEKKREVEIRGFRQHLAVKLTESHKNFHITKNSNYHYLLSMNTWLKS